MEKRDIKDLLDLPRQSLYCFVHNDWKHNINNPICLFCENERLQAEVTELKKSLKIVQKG